MIGRGFTMVALCGVLAIAPAYAAEDEVDPDRPSVSSNARTVPPGAFQVETGFEYARTSRGGADAERRLGVEALGRVGIVDRLEVQLGWEPLVHLRGPDDDTGVGDVTASLKYQLLSRFGR